MLTRIGVIFVVICSYRPGAWLQEAGGVKRNSYDIPDITTLLVVGPMGAGKSTLINNMIRVVNDKLSNFDRAQTSGRSFPVV